MGVKVTKEKITREQGYMYFIGKDGYVWAAPMRNNPKGKKRRVGTEQITREPGFLYYVGSDGYVERAAIGKRKTKK
jgi:hypothetical protein